MKKSITIIGKSPIDHVYVIRDVDIDKVTVEKWSAECRENIDNAWGLSSSPSSDQSTFPNYNDRIFEVVLKEKINNVTLTAKPNVIETVARLGGKIIKDFKVERTKRGKKVYISDIELFKEPVGE